MVWPRGAVVGGRGAGWWGRWFLGAAPRVGLAAGERLRQTPPQDSDLIEKTCGPPNELRISRRERAAQETVKIVTISRAKRSGCMRMFGRSR